MSALKSFIERIDRVLFGLRAPLPADVVIKTRSLVWDDDGNLECIEVRFHRPSGLTTRHVQRFK